MASIRYFLAGCLAKYYESLSYKKANIVCGGRSFLCLKILPNIIMSGIAGSSWLRVKKNFPFPKTRVGDPFDSRFVRIGDEENLKRE